MCGLFGFSSSAPVKNMYPLMVSLALYNEERGRCSWGAYDGQMIHKDVGPIGRNWSKIPNIEQGLLIGHTRAATVGAVTKPNAHPFNIKSKKTGLSVIGAHNGSIRNYEELNKKYNRTLEVDSMHIFAHLADELPFDDLCGYGAITYWKNDVLYLARFNAGSLSIAQLEGGGLVWSSEEAALEKALEGAGHKYELYDVLDDHIYYVKNDELFHSKDRIKISNAKYVQQQSQQQHHFQQGNRNSRAIEAWNGMANRGNGGVQRDAETFRVRLRILRDRPLLDGAMDEAVKLNGELDAIKTAIFKDDNISTTGHNLVPCTSCKTTTTRELLTGEPQCLTCCAIMVHSGKLPVPAKAQKEEENVVSPV